MKRRKQFSVIAASRLKTEFSFLFSRVRPQKAAKFTMTVIIFGAVLKLVTLVFLVV